MRAMEQKVTEAIDFPSWLVMKENCQQSICFTLFGDPGVSSTLQYVDGVVAVTVDDRSRGDDDVSSLSKRQEIKSQSDVMRDVNNTL